MLSVIHDKTLSFQRGKPWNFAITTKAGINDLGALQFALKLRKQESATRLTDTGCFYKIENPDKVSTEIESTPNNSI